MSRTLVFPEVNGLAAARPYPEREEEDTPWHDRAAEFLVAQARRAMPSPWKASSRDLERLVAEVEQGEQALRHQSDARLLDEARQLRRRIRREGLGPAQVAAGFALVREGASRTLGRRHFDTQLMAGAALLRGRLVEMATGEGKTFAATLPACVMAMAGYPVHVVTVNDYLAARDAEEMAALYGFFGLAVGTVVQGLPTDERRAAYRSDVTYCSNKELAFDYLRDRTRLGHRASRLHLALGRLGGEAAQSDGGLVLRGLWYGLVDEADSIFVDEARTPLILSASVPTDDDEADCRRALEMAGQLVSGTDYRVLLNERRVRLLPAGEAQLGEWSDGLGGVWALPRAREERIVQALTALHLFHRDQHYVVGDEKVQIVDESTGRLMPDRSWEQGLHQMIETKEGCALTDRRETLARITYQRLFRRYLRLAGMSGTASEVAPEIREVYRLDVVPVPLNRPSRRQWMPDRLCRTEAEKWALVADRVAEVAVAAGRPVLIGTRSVQASETLSAVLTARGIAHALLNAKQDVEEASIIAEAGRVGRVTVATNMAGRGTDIHLGPGVEERGGLHVILTEFHESRRVDRQLFGRCARQGDPGSCEVIVSLEDEVFAVHAPRLTGLLKRLAGPRGAVPAWGLNRLRRAAQDSAERRSARVRMSNMKLDRRMEQMLAFSGRGE